MGSFTWNKHCNEFRGYGNFNEMYQNSEREFIMKRSDLILRPLRFFIYVKNKFADLALLLIFQPLREIAGSERFRVLEESVIHRLNRDRQTY